MQGQCGRLPWMVNDREWIIGSHHVLHIEVHESSYANDHMERVESPPFPPGHGVVSPVPMRSTWSSAITRRTASVTVFAVIVAPAMGRITR